MESLHNQSVTGSYTSGPSYQPTRTTGPPYHTADTRRPTYQPPRTTGPPYRSSGPVHKHFEPEPRPDTWNKQLETETEAEQEPLSRNGSSTYSPREIEDLLYATKEFMGRENNSKHSTHQRKDKGYKKERIGTKARSERNYEEPLSDIDAELEESRVLEDVFFVQ